MIYETTNTKQNQSLKSPNTPLKTDPKTQPTPSQHPSKKKSIHPPDTSPHHPQHPPSPSPSPPITQNTFTHPPLRKISPAALQFVPIRGPIRKPNSCKFVKFVDPIRVIRGQSLSLIPTNPTPCQTTKSKSSSNCPTASNTSSPCGYWHPVATKPRNKA